MDLVNFEAGLRGGWLLTFDWAEAGISMQSAVGMRSPVGRLWETCRDRVAVEAESCMASYDGMQTLLTFHDLVDCSYLDVYFVIFTVQKHN